MAGKSNTSATFFAQKKLLGKANTSLLKSDGEELIGSNIQAASSLVFGQRNGAKNTCSAKPWYGKGTQRAIRHMIRRANNGK